MAKKLSPLAEMHSQQKKLLAQLADAPVLDVAGVVHPSGPGGVQLGARRGWYFRLWLTPWRTDSGNVHTDKLTLYQKVTQRELDRLMDTIKAYDVLRVRARVVMKPVDKDPHAMLENIVGPDADPELNAHAQALQSPVTRADRSFGTLTLDRRLGWYTATAQWQGTPVTLTVTTDKPKDLEKALQTARTLWQDQAGWGQRIADYAVSQLLQLKNESWLDEGEADVSPEQFKQRMKLDSVSVDPDGGFAFWHNDGDLFWGHAIQITGSLAAGPTGADIPG